jgi:hypothetical protein
MSPFLSVVPALIIGTVLIVSGAAKIRRPDSIEDWSTLGVPTLLLRTSFVRLHPYGEVILGTALLAVGSLIGVAVALLTTGLLFAYSTLIIQAFRHGDRSSCMCFGRQQVITRLTIVRNAWFLLLAGMTVATISANPLWGGALASAVSIAPWLPIALLASAITVVLTLGQPSSSHTTADRDGGGTREIHGGEGIVDYVRTRTPSIPLLQADGSLIDLRVLSMERPLLLLAVTPGCAACAPVLEHLEDWRTRLPELSIRLLLGSAPTEEAESGAPQPLHDPEGRVRASIKDWATPTATLFGVDGMLAGGPVTGFDEIASFIHAVDENLHGTATIV